MAPLFSFENSSPCPEACSPWPSTDTATYMKLFHPNCTTLTFPLWTTTATCLFFAVTFCPGLHYLSTGLILLRCLAVHWNLQLRFPFTLRCPRDSLVWQPPSHTGTPGCPSGLTPRPTLWLCFCSSHLVPGAYWSQGWTPSLTWP